MAPQSANERYASVLSAKINDLLAQDGSPLAEPSAAPSSRRANKSNRYSRRTAGHERNGRHSRKCQICNHPQRQAIEDDFIDWNRASWIEESYGLHGESVIYRHARATGLDVRRRENLRGVVEKVLEEVSFIATPTAFAVLRAVRTLACLNERGQWTEPPTTHHVVSITKLPAKAAHSSTSTAPRRAARRSPMQMISDPSRVTSTKPAPASSLHPGSTAGRKSQNSAPLSRESLASSVPPRSSNRQTYEKLEMGATRSKQRSEVISNRQT